MSEIGDIDAFWELSSRIVSLFGCSIVDNLWIVAVFWVIRTPGSDMVTIVGVDICRHIVRLMGVVGNVAGTKLRFGRDGRKG